jgi:mercuric ion transport protein
MRSEHCRVRHESRENSSGHRARWKGEKVTEIIEKPAQRRIGEGAAIFTVAGLAAAFGLAACCALPMALASLGVGTTWLMGIALFAAFHRPVFLIVAAVGLLGGALLMLLYRDRIPAVGRWLVGAGLLIGAVLLYYGYTYV